MNIWFYIVFCVMFAIVMALQFVLLVKCFAKTSCDYILVRTGFGGTMSSNNGIFAVPFLHHLEKIPSTVQKLRYERTAEAPLRFSCGTTATLISDFMLRVNATTEDAERAITFLGASRLNSSRMIDWIESGDVDHDEMRAVLTEYIRRRKTTIFDDALVYNEMPV